MNFETGLLPQGLALPALQLLFGGIALASDAIEIGLLLVVIGLALLALFQGSALRVDPAGTICVRMWDFRTRCIPVAEVSWVTAESSDMLPTAAPTLRIDGSGGRHVSIRLGCWRREPELLERLEGVSLIARVRTDRLARQLFRRKPPGAFWIARTRIRRPRARPFTRRPIDQFVYAAGISIALIGSALLLWTIQARPGLGRLGLVPKAVVGMDAVALGMMAVLVARPRREVNRIVGHVLVPVGVAISVALPALVVALTELAPWLSIDRVFARITVGVGMGSAVMTFTLGFAVGLVRLLRAAWQRVDGDRLS